MRYSFFKQDEWDNLQKLILAQIHMFPGCIVDESSFQRYANIIKFSCDSGNLLAKVFHLSSTPMDEWNQRMTQAYDKEVKVYTQLPDWWHVQLVKTITIPNACYIIILTNIQGTTNWSPYTPSPGCDESIAKCLLKQLLELEKIGVQHNDLKFRNVVLIESENKAVIVDYDHMEETTPTQANAFNIADIVTTLGSHTNTKNIATQLVKMALQCRGANTE